MKQKFWLFLILALIVVVSGCSQQQSAPSIRLCTGELEIIDTDGNLTASLGIGTVDKEPTKFVRFEPTDRVFVIENQANRPIVIYKDLNGDGVFNSSNGDENILYAIDGDTGVDASTKQYCHNDYDVEIGKYNDFLPSGVASHSTIAGEDIGVPKEERKKLEEQKIVFGPFCGDGVLDLPNEQCDEPGVKCQAGGTCIKPGQPNECTCVWFAGRSGSGSGTGNGISDGGTGDGLGGKVSLEPCVYALVYDPVYGYTEKWLPEGCNKKETAKANIQKNPCILALVYDPVYGYTEKWLPEGCDDSKKYSIPTGKLEGSGEGVKGPAIKNPCVYALVYDPVYGYTEKWLPEGCDGTYKTAGEPTNAIVPKVQLLPCVYALVWDPVTKQYKEEWIPKGCNSLKTTKPSPSPLATSATSLKTISANFSITNKAIGGLNFTDTRLYIDNKELSCDKKLSFLLPTGSSKTFFIKTSARGDLDLMNILKEYNILAAGSNLTIGGSVLQTTEQEASIESVEISIEDKINCRLENPVIPKKSNYIFDARSDILLIPSPNISAAPSPSPTPSPLQREINLSVYLGSNALSTLCPGTTYLIIVNSTKSDLSFPGTIKIKQGSTIGDNSIQSSACSVPNKTCSGGLQAPVNLTIGQFAELSYTDDFGTGKISLNVTSC